MHKWIGFTFLNVNTSRSSSSSKFKRHIEFQARYFSIFWHFIGQKNNEITEKKQQMHW